MLRNIIMKKLPTAKKGVKIPVPVIPTSTPELNAQSLRNILSSIKAMRKGRPRR